ncbi:hypothetical protein [Actinoplanes subglobosus]|uniref:Uncharacterized protein n=1 Tax=Actinoplanes subglobosus TaxID=1547892 RepID=A0ABV8INR6_9ACTN
MNFDHQADVTHGQAARHPTTVLIRRGTAVPREAGGEEPSERVGRDDPNPCWSGGVLVFVEESAEPVVSMDM